MSRIDPEKDDLSYVLPHWRENLFVIFGTTSLMEIVLPIHRDLPLNGLEWTFMNLEQGNDQEKLIK
jgi:hypothetical protein